MAKALPAGRPVRRRAMFGLFDSDGWGWASTKAFFWLLVLIMALGYIPDRAYYFVVSRTLELGILGWSPVNLCPPENGTDMPCPVPAGGIVPWQALGAETALPAPRTQGAAAQLGTNLLFIGGSDGSAPQATTFVSTITGATLAAWTEGPALPEARANASIAILSGTAYLVGGLGPDGEPTDTVWSIGLDPETGALGEWTEIGEEGLTLPEGRAGSAAAAVTDGIIVAGGVGPDGQPTSTVWKSTLDEDGVLGEFTEQPSLAQPVTDAAMALEGTFLWVFGGADANGPTATVQRGTYGSDTTGEGEGEGQPSAAATQGEPIPSGEETEGVSAWAVAEGSNLPVPRTGAAGWAANGTLYLAGGSDGSAAQRQLYWAVPEAVGDLSEWRTIDKTDLPEGVTDGAAVVSGSNAFVIGGSNGGTRTGTFRANLAPQEPFFQVGLVGIVVPGLQIGGEIGQQLGYLAAAGVGTGNFVLLVIVGWAFNHQPMIRGWWERRKAAREAQAPSPQVDAR